MERVLIRDTRNLEGRPICDCHQEPMYVHLRNTDGTVRKWQCAVRRRSASKALYHDRMANDPAWVERKRAIQRERWPARAADPVYRLERQLHEIVRVRIR